MSELDQYDYELPRHLIAQAPLANRADARLLVVDRSARTLSHRYVRDLPELLLPGDALVLNDTKVIPARLVGRRTETGGHWEGLFLDAAKDGLWRVICKTRGHPKPGETVTLIDRDGRDAGQLVLGARQAEGIWIVRPGTIGTMVAGEDALTLLERVGRVPLPPYIRGGEMVDADRHDYQTVFARHAGAIAAPTAGLHFTESLLRKLEKIGVALCWVTLHVGAATFRPIVAENLAEHRMEAEWAELSRETADRLSAARRQGGRVIAVGTTAVRVLETAARGVGRIGNPSHTVEPFTGKTELFIHPPYQFRAVDALMTNFHLPRTTLLVLVRTFGGDELVRAAYEEAIREEYRFFSYGDAMLIL